MLSFKSLRPISGGFSEDKKYRATKSDGSNFFLRVSKNEEYEHKKSQFDMMKKVSKINVPICQPIDFGMFKGGVYTLLSWEDGKDAEKAIPDSSEKAQYEYGVFSGEMLSKIHSLKAPENQEQWDLRFNIQIDKKKKKSLKKKNTKKTIKYK